MATSESEIMDVLKEQSNVMNRAYQEFQSSLRILLNQLIESGLSTDQQSVYEANINRLLSDHSFQMNRLDASYIDRCQNSLNNVSATTPLISKPIKTSPCSHAPNADRHPMSFSPTQSKEYQPNFGNHSDTSFGLNLDENHDDTVDTESSVATNSKPPQIPQCKHCGQTFNRDCDLYSHIRNKHNLPPFTCDVEGCGATFDWNRDLRQHQLSHQSNQKVIAMHSHSQSRRTHYRESTAMFSCDHCGQHYAQKKNLHSHLRDCHDISPWACNIDGCTVTFRYHRDLRKHQKTDHQPTSPVTDGNEGSISKYHCHECGRSFSRSSALRAHHIQKHTVETPFHCDYSGCYEAFKLKKYLYHHIRTYHGGKPFSCTICDEKFKYKTELNEHWKLQHEDESVNEANDVLIGIDEGSMESDIDDDQHRISRRHRRRKHFISSDSEDEEQTQKIWECTECDLQYEHQSSLRRHNRKKHGVSRDVTTSDIDCHPAKRRRISSGSVQQNGINQPQPRYECNICFKVFSSSNALGGHKSGAHRTPKTTTYSTEASTATGRAVCQHCGTSFMQKSDLNRHIRDFHDLPPFQCDVDGCGASFHWTRDLREHRKLQHSAHRAPAVAHSSTSNDERDGAHSRFQCSICGKVLSDATKLKNHKLLHSAERPHKCHLCDSAFVVKERLRNHLLLTHQVKPYQCKRCSEGFTKRKDFMEHHVQCPGVMRSEIEKNEKVEERSSVGEISKEHETIQTNSNRKPVLQRSIFNHRL